MYVFKLIFPFIIALFIHFLIDPIIDYFESDRINRKIVVIHVYIMIVLISFILIYMLFPSLYKQCLIFYKQCTQEYIHLSYVKQFIKFFKQNGLTKYIMGILSRYTKSLLYWGSNIILGAGISFYLSYDNIHFIEHIVNYIPFSKQNIYRKYLKKTKLVTYSFMKSLVFDFLYFFIMCMLSFAFIDSHFIYISLFLSITNLIPYIGPYIGGIPLVIYEYMINPTNAYITIIIIFLLQYIESSFIQPYLFSKCIDLHPILQFFALSLFGDLFGIVGMIFSPLLLIYCINIYYIFKETHMNESIKKYLFYREE
jgi:predicted PurR-regulated permease PerM